MKTSLDNNGSLLKTSLDYVKNDFNIRFRPLFYPYYVFEVWMFGVNFFALSIFTGMLAFFSFAFFYFGMRKLGHSEIMSIIFVLLIFLGPQAAIWWRLGTNETIAMFFLGLCFLFMSKCLVDNNYKSNNILFIIFLSIASLCKESFIIVIPAFVVYKIINEKEVFKITLKNSVRKNVLSIFPLMLMMFEIAIIKFVVGTNQIGYAGVTSSISEFIIGIKNILLNKNSLFDWLFFVGLSLITYLISFFLSKKTKFGEFIKPISNYFYFSFLLVLPNVLMHAKSGMVERYLVPTTLGLSFLIIGILENTKQVYFKSVIFVFAVVLIFFSLVSAKNSAAVFAAEGEQTNMLLSSVLKKMRSDSKILLVADPVDRYEVSDSAKIYLAYYGFNNLYVYPIERTYTTDFERRLRDEWQKWFKGRKIENMQGLPDGIIFVEKKQVSQFFAQSRIPEALYDEAMNKSDRYSFYVKK